jgi:hypothetical protein
MNEEQHFIQKWFSIGDVITLVVMLIALGVSFGSLSKDVDSLKDDVYALKNMRMTAGAEVAISTIRVKDENQDEQIAALRDELRYQRAEILNAIGKLDAKLGTQ